MNDEKSTNSTAETPADDGALSVEQDPTHAVDNTIIADDNGSPPTKTNIAAWLALTAIVLTLCSLGLGYWLWQTNNVTQRETIETLATLKAQELAQKQSLGELAEEISNKLAEVREDQHKLRDTLAEMTASPPDRELQLLLAEAEHLVQLANDRLLLEGDVRGALTALQIADRRLASNSDPALLPIRAKLSDHITALETTPTPDIAGGALALSSVEREIVNMPLRWTDAQTGSEAASPQMTGDEHWQEVVSGLWEELKTLVVIRHQDTPVRPLVAPEQRFFLYENLRLELKAARLALLRGDAELFIGSLDTASRWIGEYFDRDKPQVAGVLDKLEELKRLEIEPALPDISAALALVRAARSRTATPRAPTASAQ